MKIKPAARKARPTYAKPKNKINFKLPRWQFPSLTSIHPAWLVFLGLLILLLALLTAPQLQIQRISCQLNQDQACPPDILAELNKFQQMSFLFIPIAEIELKLRTAIPQITELDIQIANPQTLALDISLANPIAYWLASSGQPLIIYNNFTTNQQTNQSLPITQIEYPGFTVGPQGRVDHDNTMKFVVNLLMHLQASDVSPQVISITMPQEITLIYPQNQRIIVSSTQPISRQLTTLQLFLSKATMWQGLSILDVRFEKPVLMSD